MATYQNIFTQVQVQGPPEMGVPHLDGSEERLPFTTHNYWMGKLGQAQLGPLGVPRRWVVYKDLAEASKVPPEWHGWLHNTVDTLPGDETYEAKPWQKPHGFGPIPKVGGCHFPSLGSRQMIPSSMR